MSAYSDQSSATHDNRRNQAVSGIVHANPAQWDATDMAAIRSAATVFIERFGDRAAHQAAVRAEELLYAENYEGRVRWQLIAREIHGISATSSLQKFQSSLITVKEYFSDTSQSRRNR